MDALEIDLRLTVAWKGFLGAALAIGNFIGMLMGGRVSDTYGRRKAILSFLTLFSISGCLQLVVTQVVWVVLMRIILGVAMGGYLCSGGTYLAEILSAKHRGRVLASLQVFDYIGLTCGALCGWLGEGLDPGVLWRICVGVCALPATLCVLVAFMALPESVRWYMHRGEQELAYRQMEKYPGLFQEDVLEEPHCIKSDWKEVFADRNRKAVAFVTAWWAIAMFINLSFNAFVVSVLGDLGISNGARVATLLFCCATWGCILSAQVIDKIGRRPVMIVSLACEAVGFLLCGLVGQRLPKGISIAAMVVYQMATAAASTLSVIYPAEIYPTRIRSTGFAFSACTSRIFGVLGTFVTPLALQTLGIQIVFLIAGSLDAAITVAACFLAPETKGRTLAEITRELTPILYMGTGSPSSPSFKEKQTPPPMVVDHRNLHDNHHSAQTTSPPSTSHQRSLLVV